MAPRLHDGRRLRYRREAHYRGIGRRPAFERDFPGLVVYRPCVSPLRTDLGQWRPDRRHIPPTERQEAEAQPTLACGRLMREPTIRVATLSSATVKPYGRCANRIIMI